MADMPLVTPTNRAQLIVRQYEDLKSRWTTNWYSTTQELADYIHPRRNQIRTQLYGAKQTTKLFKSTPLKANADLAASMHGALTNPVLRWFRIRMRQKELNDDIIVAQWLEECSQRMYLAYQDSNFDSEIQELYMDLGAFGIGSLYLEERGMEQAAFNGFRFLTLQIGDYVISENADGRVDVLYREFSITPRAAASKWGQNSLSDHQQRMVETKPEEPFTVLHAVYPRGDTTGKKGREALPWASCYLEMAQKKIVSEGGFHDFPFMVPRWAKAGREVYGRGPGHNALPDIKTLNRNTELRLRALGKIVDPPLAIMDDSVIGRVRLTPGAENIVRVAGAITAIQTMPHIKDALVEEERLSNDIKQMFYNDLLSLPDKTIITAAEVERRVEQIQRVLGPTIGRLTSELLTPLIERSFGIMLRRGAFPEPPQQVLQAAADKGDAIDIEYEGPLARAQKSSELQAIQRMYELMTPLANLRPEVLDILDDDKIARRIISLSGVPMDIERTEEAVSAIRQAREAAHEQEQQKNDMLKMAEAGGKAAPLLKNLQAMAGQALPPGMAAPGAAEAGTPTPLPLEAP